MFLRTRLKGSFTIGLNPSPEDVVIFINDGTGKYQMTSYATGVGSLDMIAADFSNDGNPDLAFVDYYTYVRPTVTVLLHK